MKNHMFWLFLLAEMVGISTAIGQSRSSGFSFDGTLYGYRDRTTQITMTPCTQLNLWQSIYKDNLYVAGRISMVEDLDSAFVQFPSSTLIGVTWVWGPAFEARMLTGIPQQGTFATEVSMKVAPEDYWIQGRIVGGLWNNGTKNMNLRCDLRIKLFPIWDFGGRYYTYTVGNLPQKNWVGPTTAIHLNIGSQTKILLHGELLFTTERKVATAGATYIATF